MCVTVKLGPHSSNTPTNCLSRIKLRALTGFQQKKYIIKQKQILQIKSEFYYNCSLKIWFLDIEKSYEKEMEPWLFIWQSKVCERRKTTVNMFSHEADFNGRMLASFSCLFSPTQNCSD